MPRSYIALVGIVSLLTGCLPFLSSGSDSGYAFGTIMDPAVRQGTLDNGLTYFIRENREPRDRAELRLVINAGSILEDDDQRGLAHVVEHMAFNGTRGFEQHEIVDFLETIGMRFGPDVNAYTSFDETVYMLTVPTDTAGVLETAIRILEEWAWGISFDSLQVEKERGVVIEEWRLGQGAGSRLQYRQFPTLAYRSRYAQRLPIGTRESLANFTHDALRRFYDDWYRPDLMAVVAVGDFDADEVESLIQEYFGRIPPHEEPRNRREYEVPRHQETLFSIASDPELTASTVGLYIKRRPRIWRRAADHRQWVAESLAGAMLVNRLSEVTQRIDSPLLDVSSYQGRFVRTLSMFGLTARVADGRVEQALNTLLVEVERASRHGFTASELEREKREMMRVMEQRYAERQRTTSGSFAADYVSHFLYGGSVLGTDLEIELYRELIPQISLRETNARGRDWTTHSDRVVLVSVPTRPGTQPPREEFLQAIVQLSSRQAVEPYQDFMSTAPLLPNPPPPGAIVDEFRVPELDVVVWTLGNGAEVVLKPTDFRESEILFAARRPGGTSLVDDEDYIPALTAAAVVQSGGLGELSANDLRKRLTGSVAGVGADIGELYEGLSGAAAPADLETLFQLVHLKFTAPREDSAAFLAYRSQARASLANRSASPDVALLDTLRVTLAQNHPRARPPSSAMFDQLDMARSFEIYRDRFADASGFTFYFVGNFDPEEMRPLVLTYLASLPDLGRAESPRDLGIRPPRGVVEKVVRRGLEPRAATQIVFTGTLDFQRESVVAIQGLAEFLRLRLREILREDLGGTYGVEVRGSAARDPVPQYQFSIGFGADPERLEELVEVVFDEIARLKAEGPLDSDIAKVREMQFRAREVDLRQNHFWLSQLLTYTQYGWDLSEIPATATRLATLTPELIQRAANQFLDTSNYVRASLVPALPVDAGERP
jgi:zinc protease